MQSDLDKTQLAEAIKRACAEAAQNAYEDAGFSGLCAEGGWECAIEAIRHLDVSELVRQVDDTGPPAKE